jgi:Lrp/AsnC family leucine-responsive transcriptional regulator
MTPSGRRAQHAEATDSGASRSAKRNGTPQARRERMPRIKFDAIDLAILEQLQADSKITNATLAQRVGISPPSTLERVKKLENSGIIRGYVAVLDPIALDKSITALVHVTLREHGREGLTKFKNAVAVFGEVQAAWHTTGEEDFILKVVVTDMEQYEQFVVHRLSAIPNIGRIRTSFCLGSVKDETRVPLDAVGGTTQAPATAKGE